jgi:2-polyprenyl-3-methyl-5-hydroxy-6-metoxy-1,4-benzoquinol methylase
MFKRVIESDHGDYFDSMENAREYARTAEKSAKMRFGGFLKILNSLNIKGNYLEIGAGSGILATMIAEMRGDIHITATDTSENMLTIAKEYIDKRNIYDRIQLIAGDVENENFLKRLKKYDLIYSTFSMHHWKNPQKIILNLFNILNDQGALLIYDLKRVWWLYWIPKQSGFLKSIRASYRPKEIKKMFADAGIKNYKLTNIFPFFLHNITIRKK